METIATQPNALKRALLLDAVASGTMGLLLVIAASQLERLLGLPLNLLRYSGIFLIPFAAMLLWLATKRHAIPGITWLIVIGNVAWVVASVVLLVSGVVRPTVLGETFVLAQAAAVGFFAFLEFQGLRRRGRILNYVS